MYGCLEYPHTNEYLHSIIAGLDPKKEDKILAIAGSGDQAFALLSYGARVRVVDSDEDQIIYVRKRIDELGKGDYSSFENFDSYSFNDQNKVFFADESRRETIRRNLSNLEVINPKCVFRGGIDFSVFNKVYLSNVNEWHSDFSPKYIHDMAKVMPVGSLIYTSREFRIPFWWANLRINDKRTKAARDADGGYWNPFVTEVKGSPLRLFNFNHSSQ